MIKDIKELNFPAYATLTAATCSLPDMAERTIASTVRVDPGIAPDFSYDWEVEFRGEKYIMPLRQPQGAIDNEKFFSSIDLTFQHWAVWQLKRWYFFSIVNLEAGTVLPDQYVYPVLLNLKDFCTLFGKVLRYYYGDTITIDLNPDWEYEESPTSVEISHTHIWDVLIKFYELFAVRWQIEPRIDNDNETPGGERYVIRVGYPATEIGHIFEYGFEGGLLKVERQVQDENIRNMIIGRGGDRNLPYRYFKEHDKDNESFSPDPDWVPELADRYFSELHGATFRSYVQGWNHRHYGRTSVTSADMAYSPWAWLKGYNDTVFNPVEFVTDEIVASPEPGDRYVRLLPDFTAAIKKDSSIDKYGPLIGGLDNNEDIYPTFQGLTLPDYGRIDQVVAVQEILSDDIEDVAESDVTIRDFGEIHKTVAISKGETAQIPISGHRFSVSEGEYANILTGAVTLSATFENGAVKWVCKLKDGANSWDGIDAYEWTAEKEEWTEDLEDAELPTVEGITGYAVNMKTGEKHTLSGIPEGDWMYYLTVTVHNGYEKEDSLNVTASVAGTECVRAVLTGTDTPDWRKWNIWVKNIWQTSKKPDESGVEYADRVWDPILGDHTGDEAKIVFSSGWLSTSEDYEFAIVATPEYDPDKTIFQFADGSYSSDESQAAIHGGILAQYSSEWKLTLAKSDADLEATGLYVPSTKRQANAGDYFFIIGIDMPHLYVVDAEMRLDNWKKDELAKVKDIKPTWVVSLDKVRIHNHGNPGAIIDSIHPGDTLTLRDERFISGSHQEKLYLTTITYTYTEPTDTAANLLPDVEVVLSDSYTTSANPVSQIASEVTALQKQIRAISNIAQIVRAVGDKLYLRKDGFADRSYSPTEFASLLTSAEFRSGLVGGKGWGFFKDENGNWVLETDRVSVRQEMDVNSLVINQTEGQGGTIVESAASMEIIRVEETSDGYICYFDQKNGSVANLFHVDDIAMNHRYTPENRDLKFYRRRVMAVNEDSVTLTKGYAPVELSDGTADTGVNGTGEPAVGDVIIQRGSYSDPDRRYIKVRDVIGGGYERYIEGLDSVNAEGTEYFYVGRQPGMYGNMPRWYIGNPGSYIEYVDRKFNLNNVALSVNSTIGGKTIQEIIDGTDIKYIKDALHQNTFIDRGLILTSTISLGTGNTGVGEQQTFAGLNGIVDKELLGRSIAAWYGGSMIDREIPENESNPDRARALFRMDGSGYLSDGRLSWDTGGNLTLGSGIKVAGLDGDLNGMLNSFVKFTTGLNRLMVPVDKDDNVLPWTDVDTAVAIRITVGAYSQQFLSVLGTSDDGGSGGGMDEVLLEAYLREHRYVTEDTLGILNTGVSQEWVLGQGYVTRDWVLGQKYLTAHQPLHTLTLRRDGGTVGTFTPDADAVIDITDVASAATLDGHIGDTTAHVTEDEREKWNKVVTDFSAITGTDSDSIINKWEEVVAFLANYTEADTLGGLLGHKADKATTLSGYGITDAYTRTDIDGRFSAVNTDIRNLGNRVTSLEELFTKESDGNGGWRIKANFGLYSNEFISVLGAADDAGGGGVSAEWLASNGYLPFEDTMTRVKEWVGGQDFGGQVDLSEYLTQTGAAALYQPKGNYLTSHQDISGKVNKSGDTMSGALNFANFTWNAVGDDSAMGDCNVAGCFGIKGLNGLPGIDFFDSGNTELGVLRANGTMLQWRDNPLWHAGNFNPGDYLPLSGGTMTGSISMGNVGNVTNLPVGGGLYWNPYVESDTDPTDAASITLIKAGVAGGSELRISMLNDADDVVNLVGGNVLKNGAAIATESWVGGAFVTLNTPQTISGVKVITARPELTGNESSFAARAALLFHHPNAHYTQLVMGASGDINVLDGGATDFNYYRGLRASHFMVYGGTSSQFLMADGSVKTNGHGGGVDADLWDGEHLSSFRMRKYYTIDTSSLPTSYFYPVTVDPSDLEWDCEIHSRNTAGGDPWNQNHIHFLMTGQGWSDTARTMLVLSQGVYQTSEITIGAVGSGDQVGGLCVWVRGGNTYRIYSNRVPTLRTSDYWYGNECYAVGPNFHGGSNSCVSVFWSADNPDNFKAANLQSNVASASKLADNTARTAWGQTFFSGGVPQSVSGYLSGVSGMALTASGCFNMDDYGNFRATLDTDNHYWNIYRYDGASALCVKGSSGYVGIGTTSPAYKLDVNGDIIAGHNSWIRTRGQSGWYSETYGGGWYMNDADWIRTFNNKNVYANTAVIRTDGEFHVGDSGWAFRVTAGGRVTANSDIISGWGYIIAEHGAVQGPAWILRHPDNSPYEMRVFTTADGRPSFQLYSNGNWANTPMEIRADGRPYLHQGIVIGGATIYWDEANQCLRTDRGFVADEFLSTLGETALGDGYSPDERIIVAVAPPAGDYDDTDYGFVATIVSINGITNRSDTKYRKLLQRFLDVVRSSPNVDITEASRLAIYVKGQNNYNDCFYFCGVDDDNWVYFGKPGYKHYIYLFDGTETDAYIYFGKQKS